MHVLRRLWAAGLVTSLVTFLSGGLAHAQTPKPWQMNLQQAHSPVAESLASLNQLVFWIITIITVFVAGLLAWVAYRYSAKKNPTPSRVSHNTMLEVAWTLIPVLILVVIAIPSFRLVYLEDRTQEADITIKVVGHQWYWEYDYADTAKINFLSRMIPNDEIKPGQLRLLDVDNQLVVPAGKNVRILTTSADVIHSFFIPSLGVQRYAIPGRTIETWFRVNGPGTYYGECNQICGTQHSGMPIAIKALPPAEFQAWLVTAKTKFASEPSLAPENPQGSAPTRIAQILP
jgi:cytochrome c oxidase subunit 2